MNIRFYQILGYAGVIPFLVCACLAFLAMNDGQSYLLGLVTLFYAGMIASFLAGLHWMPAVRDGLPMRAAIAMVPTIMALFLVLLSSVIGFVIPLLIMVGLFWGIYFFEGRSDIHEPIAGQQEYKRFRFYLTLIVSLCLALSAIGFIL